MWGGVGEVWGDTGRRGEMQVWGRRLVENARGEGEEADRLVGLREHLLELVEVGQPLPQQHMRQPARAQRRLKLDDGGQLIN